ncbi:dipeptidyl aminopeptidase/acylaminoacyl peptidase [Glaciihabitans tibetensis]|uniref:Dipeptidyl aminopeptidase/acylaminoacyl peptidase n=1 Tax=Glaciihabitans tibetensis TaxID=1266600 RepID=A0A2T0VGP2_9MICO|nr:S9 family peptidase [Glaciihabitans tibetensis]PRY69387.1 dipeptidyl aminopeptidase/acylaminoacyl peptidase [Glaciihabitans tibetensis]
MSAAAPLEDPAGDAAENAFGDAAENAPENTPAEGTAAAGIWLAKQLVGAWGSWGPTLSSDALRVAFISDRRGTPELWVQTGDDAAAAALPISLSEDPVLAVRWSADDAWLACAVATDGGVRTQVWVVRPDGSDARRLAGSREVHAQLGPWTRSGHRVVVTIPSTEPGEPTLSLLADPATGEFTTLATGDLITVLDLSIEERLAVLRDGRRGHQFCVVVDRLADQAHTLLPQSAVGSTEVALVRPAPEGDPNPLVVYLVTEALSSRHELVAMPIGPNNWRGTARVLAARPDADLEGLDADDAGRLLLLVWNVVGTSEIELLDTTTGRATRVPELPGLVASDPILSRDGSTVVLGVESPERPREIWRLDTGTLLWNRVTDVPELPRRSLVRPTLEAYVSGDGLPLTGWLYRAPDSAGARPGRAMLSLHGGPEAQERPTFSPQHQAMVAAGITVFAPNVRGSSGFGRAFVHADDVEGRYGAFADVIASARHVVSLAAADRESIAVTGRSYGGYLTLASLAFTPGVFAAGVDICGMSDLHTFYRDTEPWIAAAAVTKYGHPRRDRTLLRAISPLRSVDAIAVPLLVVHGEHDTNVPIGEAHQIVAALRKRRRTVDYLELEGEGHDFRRADSRILLISTMIEFLWEHLPPGRDPGSDPGP